MFANNTFADGVQYNLGALDTDGGGPTPPKGTINETQTMSSSGTPTTTVSFMGVQAVSYQGPGGMITMNGTYVPITGGPIVAYNIP
jgi:hypothetical protein